LVRQPLATSLFEELLFRGILQALAIRSWGVVRGVAWVSLAFALWHLVVNYRTIRATAVGHVPALFWLAQLAALIGVAAGSLVLSILRLRTGGLSAPVGFHWAVVVTMRGALLAAS
jgi:membrane protease YdiL (CAAX protease family)